MESIFYIELFAAFLGIIYSFLMAKKRSIGWIFGVASCALLAWISFDKGLFFQVLAQAINVGMGVWGYVQWKQSSPVTRPLERRSAFIVLTLNLAGAGCVSDLFWQQLLNWTQSIDIIILLWSITGTLLTIYKIKDSWYYWIGVNVFTGILAIGVNLYFFAGLSFLYLLVSVYGLYEWNRNEK